MFQFMVLKIFQNCLLLYQWHHTAFYVKKITRLIILVDIMSHYEEMSPSSFCVSLDFE
jgi:hypothetical protein